MEQLSVSLCIPEGVRFEDLGVSINPSSGELQVDPSPLARVAEASGFDDDFLNDFDTMMAILCGWYMDHVEEGGVPNLVMEEFLALPAAEDCGGFVPPLSSIRRDH